MKVILPLLLSFTLFTCQKSDVKKEKASIQKFETPYQIGEESFIGYIAAPTTQGLKPGVIVVHEWWGHNEHSRKRADELATLGYVALALDMYGDGKQAEHPKEAGEFATAVLSNKELARTRFEKALEILKSHPDVDKTKIAAIGYCFGGGVVLQMARAGVDLKGVAVFHGMLGTDVPAKAGDIKASIIVFNGEDDPMASKPMVATFEEEMKNAGAKYVMIQYPGVKHAFTNPKANDFAHKFGLPLAYNKKADEDSWLKLEEFLKEIFKN
ncbi:MAG: dienelactone hydrolase family protein [Bacteriovoracaceae bacterium]|nr:dienelactone hydrolase family protein [Bacteriovoracaceae bacterium]